MRLLARLFTPSNFGRPTTPGRLALRARDLCLACTVAAPLLGCATNLRTSPSPAADVRAPLEGSRVPPTTAAPRDEPDVSPDVGQGTEALPPQLRRVFFGTIEDSAPPERGGVTEARKNKQYLTGNEKSLFAFHRAIAGVGGGYVGVGSDQAYLFIGWARPQLAWLTDYDPDVVRIHRVHRAFFLAFADPESFLAAWSKEGTAQAVAALEAHCDPDELDALRRLYFRHRVYIHRRLSAIKRTLQRRRLPSYLEDPSEYLYVRRMLEQERIRPMLVNLLDGPGLTGVAEASHVLDVPIRVLYLSNAEEYWERYPDNYRASIAGFRIDERAVLLRTLLIWDINQDYRYNVQPLRNYQEWLTAPFVRNVYDIVHARPPAVPDALNLFYTDDAPAASPRAKRAARHVSARP